MSESAHLPPDPTHPFHRASFWLDHRKLIHSGGGPSAIVKREQMIEELKELLDANHSAVDAASLLKAIEYYGMSYTVSTGIPIFLTFSIFCDAVMHALAFTGHLEADPPVYPDPKKKPHVH